MMDTTYFMKMSHAQAAMKAADEIYALRQRVAELEEMYELSADVASTTLACNAELTAERDELRDDKKAGFDRVFEAMHDDPEDPYDRKWSTICLHISSQHKEITQLTAERDALKQQRDELVNSAELLIKAMAGTQAETDFAFSMFMLEDAIASVNEK